METKLIQTFITVAELNSFSQAAKKLGYSQPTVSLQIKQLEEELHVPLFERVGHTIKLTEQGHQKLMMAQAIHHELQAFITPKTDSYQGSVHIAMADSLCDPLITKHFQQFHEQYPHIDWIITTGGTFDMYSMIDHNQVDIVCTLDDHLYDMTHLVTNEEKIPCHFVASKHHALAHQKNISIEQLMHYDFILTEKNMSYRRKLDTLLAQKQLEIKPILEFASTQDICEIILQNVGISFLPDFVVEPYIEKHEIVYLDIPEIQLHVWKQIFIHKEKWISPVLQATIDFLSNIHLQKKSLL